MRSAGEGYHNECSSSRKIPDAYFCQPQAHGSYQGFEYDAIAIAYENSDIVNVLDISAFNGHAKSYVVHPDGRVVIDHSF